MLSRPDPVATLCDHFAGDLVQPDELGAVGRGERAAAAGDGVPRHRSMVAHHQQVADRHRDGAEAPARPRIGGAVEAAGAEGDVLEQVGLCQWLVVHEDASAGIAARHRVARQPDDALDRVVRVRNADAGDVPEGTRGLLEGAGVRAAHRRVPRVAVGEDDDVAAGGPAAAVRQPGGQHPVGDAEGVLHRPGRHVVHAHQERLDQRYDQQGRQRVRGHHQPQRAFRTPPRPVGNARLRRVAGAGQGSHGRLLFGA